jgi:SAM-dependent methyltransferase
VLELAAGTGVLTRELIVADRSLEVVATDLNEAMVTAGRDRAPAATWRQADATQLPFADNEFDVIACQFGAMFFPDKRAAFAETRRVLTADGRLLMNIWNALETHDFQAALVASLERVFPADPPTFMASVPHGYGDPDVVVADLAAAGLHHVRVDTIVLEGHAASVAELAAGYCLGTPLRAGIEARGDLEAATERVAREMEARLGTGPVTGRMSAHVIEAAPAP